MNLDLLFLSINFRKELRKNDFFFAYIPMHSRLSFIMDGKTMNPDQTAPKGAVRLGFILFAI